MVLAQACGESPSRTKPEKRLEIAADALFDLKAASADITVSVTTRQKSAEVTQIYSCEGEADQWRCTASAKMSDFSCDIAAKEIYLRRGANGTMMLANPNNSLPIIDLCSKAADGKTTSDDKVYRLEPMPQSACAP